MSRIEDTYLIAYEELRRLASEKRLKNYGIYLNHKTLMHCAGGAPATFTVLETFVFWLHFKELQEKFPVGELPVVFIEEDTEVLGDMLETFFYKNKYGYGDILRCPASIKYLESGEVYRMCTVHHLSLVELAYKELKRRKLYPGLDEIHDRMNKMRKARGLKEVVYA